MPLDFVSRAAFWPQHRIYVDNSNYASTLGNNPVSTCEYFLTEKVDAGNLSIAVSSGGIFISGYNFDLSGLYSTEDSFTLFTGSSAGDVLFKDIDISISGTGSQVYDLQSNTGNEAVEIARVNYSGCTSLGELNNFRQGLESGTGRFGGKPELCLSGAWSGGFFIDTSIVRGLTDGSYSLFKAGTGFSMTSRFRSNMNIDLPASASYLDFAPSHFPNPSTLQLVGGIVTRNGVDDAGDTNLTPNISRGDLPSFWRDNVGLDNTFVGGRMLITTEVTTTITTQNTFEVMAGTFTASDLQHFDMPVNGELRHLGRSPKHYEVFVDLVLESGSNNEAQVRIERWDDAGSAWGEVETRFRQVNALAGGRDVAFFNFTVPVDLSQNDKVRMLVANASGTTDITAELDSGFFLDER